MTKDQKIERLEKGLNGLAKYSCYVESRKYASEVLDYAKPLREFVPPTTNTPESMRK